MHLLKKMIQLESVHYDIKKNRSLLGKKSFCKVKADP
jgi:hypothetical protein